MLHQALAIDEGYFRDDPTLEARPVYCSVLRSQLEGTPPAAVWPQLADVGDQCRLWR